MWGGEVSQGECRSITAGCGAERLRCSIDLCTMIVPVIISIPMGNNNNNNNNNNNRNITIMINENSVN